MALAGVQRPYRLYIIDGTGPSDDNDYASSMRNSFCNQLDAACGPSAFYARGPTNPGFELMSLAAAAVNWLGAQKQALPEARIMLAGYSRGATAAILAARHLRPRRIDVDALFLFDAVLMQTQMAAHTLTSNIRHAYHVMRPSPDVAEHRGLIGKYEGTILDEVWDIGEAGGWTLGRKANPFRPDWGNCGRMVEDPARTAFQSMRLGIGTHGALGGVGWNGVERDEEAQALVAKWMNAYLALQGLPACLKSLPPMARLPSVGMQTVPEMIEERGRKRKPSKLPVETVRRPKY